MNTKKTTLTSSFFTTHKSSINYWDTLDSYTVEKKLLYAVAFSVVFSITALTSLSVALGAAVISTVSVCGVLLVSIVVPLFDGLFAVTL